MGMGRAEPSAPRGRRSAHATDGSPVGDELSQRLADLARGMQSQLDSGALLDVIVTTVVGTVPGAEEASVSLAQRGRRVVSAAATGDLPRRFDDLQQETRQGPCLDAMYEHETIRVVDLLFASHAAVAVAQARKLNHLGTALASRDIIGQAKGILMERYRITADQAFALLARLSQDTNRKLHEIAEYLTDTGSLASGSDRGAAPAGSPPPGRRLRP